MCLTECVVSVRWRSCWCKTFSWECVNCQMERLFDLRCSSEGVVTFVRWRSCCKMLNLGCFDCLSDDEAVWFYLPECIVTVVQMEKLSDEISKHLEDILAVGHFSLVTCLAGTCQRLRFKQDDFIMVRILLHDAHNDCWSDTVNLDRRKEKMKQNIQEPLFFLCFLTWKM